jgi:hypothetical protein
VHAGRELLFDVNRDEISNQNWSVGTFGKQDDQSRRTGSAQALEKLSDCHTQRSRKTIKASVAMRASYESYNVKNNNLKFNYFLELKYFVLKTIISHFMYFDDN